MLFKKDFFPFLPPSAAKIFLGAQNLGPGGSIKGPRPGGVGFGSQPGGVLTGYPRGVSMYGPSCFAGSGGRRKLLSSRAEKKEEDDLMYPGGKCLGLAQLSKGFGFCLTLKILSICQKIT